MNDLFSWYLELPDSAGDRAIEFRFGFSETSDALPVIGLYVLLVIFGILACVRWKTTASLSRESRAVLVCLNLLTGSLLVICLLGSSLDVVDQKPTRIDLLIDTSQSMSVADVDDPGRAEDSNRGSMERLASVKNRLRETDVLTYLVNRTNPRCYRFDRDLSRLSSDNASRPESRLASLREAIDSLAANGRRTRFESPLRGLLASGPLQQSGVLLLFTDGNSSDGEAERLKSAIDALDFSRTKIVVVGVGSRHAPIDLSLQDVDYESEALLGEEVFFDVTTEWSGVGDHRTLLQLIDPVTGIVLDRREVGFERGTSSAGAVLSHRTERTGIIEYLLRATTHPEEVNLENNQRTVEIKVDDRRISTLVAAVKPDREYRYLINTLRRENRISLSTSLMTAELGAANQDLDLLTLNADLLQTFDVIIVSLSLLEQTPNLIPRISDFISRGGGVIVWHDREIATPAEASLDLLPYANWNENPWKTTDSRNGHSLRVTPVGRQFDRLLSGPQIAGGTSFSLEMLSQPYAVFNATEYRPGSMILAEMVPEDSNEAIPLIVMRYYGVGTLLYHASNQLWRWRELREDDIYGTYWRQAIRLLAKRRWEFDRQATTLTTNKKDYRPGEEAVIALSVGARHQEIFQQPNVTCLVETADQSVQTVTLSRGIANPLLFEGSFRALVEGTHRVSCYLAGTDNRELLTATFEVTPTNREMEDIALREEELKSLMKDVGGQYLHISEFDAKVLENLLRHTHHEEHRRHTIPLWSRAELLLVLVLLLLSEWGLRRKWGLT